MIPGHRTIEARRLRAVARIAYRHPARTLGTWGLLLLLGALGAARIDVETSTDSALDRVGPKWALYQESVKLFGGDELLAVALDSPEVFDPALLETIRSLTRQLEGLPGIRRVDSLASVPLVRSAPDGSLDLSPPLAAGVPQDAATLAALREELAADLIAPGILVSRDERVQALNVLLEPNLADRYEFVVQDVRRAVADFGGRVSGVPVFRTEINLRTGSEISRFIAFTLVIVSAFLLLLFGSPRGLIAPGASGLVGIVAATAAMGATGTPLTLSTMILPSVTLALGCAYSMHLCTAAAGFEDDEARWLALEPVLLPVLLSGVTTAIGFLALTAIPVDLVRDVGAFGALGVLVIALFSVSGVPALLRLVPLPPLPHRIDRLWDRLRRDFMLPAIERGRWLILLTSAAVCGVFALGLGWLQLETDATRWFPRGSEVRESYEHIRSVLSGISPVNVVVRRDDGGSLTDADTIEALAGLEAELEAMPAVGRALSVAAPIRQLHGGFVGDPERPVPRERDAIEQYLAVLDSLTYMRDLISADHRVANVPLRVDDNGSLDLIEVAARAESWWREFGPPGTRADATGIMYEFARAQDRMTAGQVRGLALALVVIGAAMLIVLRSLPLALAAMVPNLVPLVLGFGFMGLVGIPLDAGTVIVGSLVLGIAVDDTIHVVAGYQAERIGGAERGQAIERTLSRAGIPILFTSIAIGAGFAVLCLSTFAFTRNLGIMVSAVMGICLMADLVLLPALLLSGPGVKPAGPAA